MLDVRSNGIEQVGEPLAMLGADRHGLAEAKAEGIEDAELACTALSLIGHEDDGRRFHPQPPADLFVEGSNAFARVDQEQGRVGIAYRSFGLLPHASRKRVRVLVLESGGVDDPEIEAQEASPRPRGGRASLRAGRRPMPGACRRVG